MVTTGAIDALCFHARGHRTHGRHPVRPVRAHAFAGAESLPVAMAGLGESAGVRRRTRAGLRRARYVLAAPCRTTSASPTLHLVHHRTDLGHEH